MGDINRGASASACAEVCNKDQGCAGFVYMGSQRKCWRRSQIWLTECERGLWGQESSEFMTCLRQRTCKPQGQSCQNNGDCCDNNVCFLGGRPGQGLVCAPPTPSSCVIPGAYCSPTCTGCPLQQCCGRSTCQR